MKLLYIANLRIPTEKAYGVQIAKTCEALADLGIDTILIAPYRISKVKGDFFNFYSLKRNFKFKKIFLFDFYLPGKLNILAFGLKNIISAVGLSIYSLIKNPDVIYSRDELSLYILSFFKKNLIYETHRFSNTRRFFYKRFIKNDLKVVVITNHLKEDLMKMGFTAKNILVAPDGVDFDQFDLAISQKEARDKLNLPQDKKIVAYTGHLFEWKGADILLETAKLISNFKFRISNFEDILFIFVGGMPQDIENFKKKAGNLDNVMILGQRPYKEMPLFLKAADVLVLPNSAKEEISRLYTSPLKLFEYMASGRPIIASDLPSVREILNPTNALLIIPDDPKLLAEKIQILLSDKNLQFSLAAQALELAKKYTWQARAENIRSHILENW